MAKRIRTGVVLAVAAALTVGGVAAAQQSGSSGNSQSSHQQARGQHPQGPPPAGLPTKGLTYAELHVEKNGEAKVIRVDQGKVLSVSESLVTLSENDGSEVTVAVDSETKVLGKPGTDASLEELQGKVVLVIGPSSGTAKRIVIEPKHPGKGAGGQGAHRGRHGAPPAGAAKHGRAGGRR